MNAPTRLSAIFNVDAEASRQSPSPLEHDPFFATVTDKNGWIVEVSNGLSAILGYGESDLVGRHLSELLAERTDYSFLETSCNLLGVGSSWRGDVCHRGKDGGLVWFNCLMTPLRNSESGTEQITILRTDVSARSQSSLPGAIGARFLEQTGRAANVGGWELDLDTGVTCWTDETFRIFGLERTHQPSLSEALSFFPEDARETMQAAIELASKDGSGWQLELPFNQNGGAQLWVRAVGAVEFFCGKPRRLFGAIQDITETVSRRVEVERLNERMSLAAESGSIGIWEYDLATDTLQWDRLMARLFGWPEAEMVGTFDLWARQLHHDDREHAIAACTKAISGAEPLNTEFRIVRADGDIRHVRATGRLKPKSATQGARLIGANWDITERRRLGEEMHYRATHDALTGLLNRSAFEALMLDMIQRSAADDAGALLSIDLDQFKLVNDVCGHAVGDRLLKQVTLLLQGLIPEGDVLARLGSDEFAVLARHTSLEAAEVLASNVCKCLDAFRFDVSDRRFRVSASIGVVPLDSRWTNVSSPLQAASTACSDAKEEGRNRFHSWVDADKVLDSRLGAPKWAARIEHALDEDRFELFAQIISPIAAPAGPLRAEVLLRMVDTDGKLILPGIFVPAAERFHLASRVDKWVLTNALRWLAKSKAKCPVGTLCINLSGQSIGDRAFRQHVVDALKFAGLSIASKICLEITETSAIKDLEGGAAFMADVRALGVRIALDDFGSGSSSFGYLRKLPIDYLKIDGQFIRQLTSGSLDEAAVRCFTDVARVIGVKTVAEFIESPEVLARLTEIGVDYGQGYLLHKPMPIAQLFEENRSSV